LHIPKQLIFFSIDPFDLFQDLFDLVSDLLLILMVGLRPDHPVFVGIRFNLGSVY
jgi:hypothetical protein